MSVVDPQFLVVAEAPGRGMPCTSIAVVRGACGMHVTCMGLACKVAVVSGVMNYITKLYNL